jgi:N-acetylneuraminic acid mutarotase
LVLLVLLVVIVAGFISLRLASEDILPTPEPFATTTFGEDWAATNRPLPVAQTDAAAAAAGVIVYAIGGETAAGVTNTLYAFNATEHTWRSLTPKPTAVAAASATALFGEIYVVGGRLADGQPTNVVEVYSPTQNAWRPVTALPQPIAGGLALSDGSFLYLFGGWNGSDYLDDTYVYDPGEDSWRPLASMSQPRAFATGQFMIGRLYVVGGYDGTEELALCQFLDPNSMQWDDCPDMLLPRGGAGSAAVLNKVYVIGGGKNGNQTINFNERYDPATETWQVVNTPLLDDTPSWVGLVVANVENRIFAFGGQQGDTLIADTYIYSPFIYRTFLNSVPVDNN